MNVRELQRDQVASIWTIDRREVIDKIYYLEHGQLVLRPEHYDMRGWPPGEADKYTPVLLQCFDRGGVFYGAFDNTRLVGVAVLDSRFIGQNKDQLQLTLLHVSRDYRDQGVGTMLFELARQKARERGARALYVSATPSEHTINFYLGRGCAPTLEPDPDLFALEPDDIHLVCPI